jgi:hypothetical protein
MPLAWANIDVSL